jgi:prepilin-type processing-associated H-X9-DG protein
LGLNGAPGYLNDVRIPLFRCPSDPRREQPKFNDPLLGDMYPAFTEYLGVNGRDQFAQDGLIYPNSRVSLAQVPDGTSNTLLVGERPPSFDLYYGWWFADAGWGPVWFGATGVVLGGQELSMPTALPASYGQGTLNDPTDSHIWHFWSLHPGGANFLFADGSVRRIRYGIPANLLGDLATRHGGEAVNVDF